MLLCIWLLLLLPLLWCSADFFMLGPASRSVCIFFLSLPTLLFLLLLLLAICGTGS